MGNTRRVRKAPERRPPWTPHSVMCGTVNTQLSPGKNDTIPSVALLMVRGNCHDEIPMWCYVMGMFAGRETRDRRGDSGNVWAAVDYQSGSLWFCYRPDGTTRVTVLHMIRIDQSTAQHAIVKRQIVVGFGRMTPELDALGDPHEVLRRLYATDKFYSVALRCELATEPLAYPVSG